jgi:hypothetical protein
MVRIWSPLVDSLLPVFLEQLLAQLVLLKQLLAQLVVQEQLLGAQRR